MKLCIAMHYICATYLIHAIAVLSCCMSINLLPFITKFIWPKTSFTFLSSSPPHAPTPNVWMPHYAVPSLHYTCMRTQAKREEQMLKRRNVNVGPETTPPNELVVRIFIAVNPYLPRATPHKWIIVCNASKNHNSL